MVWWVRPSLVRCSKCDFAVPQVRSRGFPRTTLCVSSCSRTCGARAILPCALKYCGVSAVLRCTWSGRRAWIFCSRTGSLRRRCAVSARTKCRVPRSFFRPAHRVTRVRVLSGCGMSCFAKIAALPRFKQAQYKVQKNLISKHTRTRTQWTCRLIEIPVNLLIHAANYVAAAQYMISCKSRASVHIKYQNGGKCDFSDFVQWMIIYFDWLV